MKTIFFFFSLAAATLAAPVSAQDASGGHYEWQTRQVPGPNKSNINPRVRVWVKDASMNMAACDCTMMKTDAAGCMHDMPGHRMSPSKG